MNIAFAQQQHRAVDSATAWMSILVAVAAVLVALSALPPPAGAMPAPAHVARIV